MRARGLDALFLLQGEGGVDKLRHYGTQRLQTANGGKRRLTATHKNRSGT